MSQNSKRTTIMKFNNLIYTFIYFRCKWFHGVASYFFLILVPCCVYLLMVFYFAFVFVLCLATNQWFMGRWLLLLTLSFLEPDESASEFAARQTNIYARADNVLSTKNVRIRRYHRLNHIFFNSYKIVHLLSRFSTALYYAHKNKWRSCAAFSHI